MHFDKVCTEEICENETIYNNAVQIRLDKGVYLNIHHSADICMNWYICVAVPVDCNIDKENTGKLKLSIT